ncbi:hypothetical protein JYU14_05250 [Simkania negevensis]|uniref:Uncharacterized protein n=1 Tax=Simkania negevensis TaxID=83561 RepID=A0ABS3ARV0_9BACT|nr:hypothetical protein [Simkania negevensis]
MGIDYLFQEFDKGNIAPGQTRGIASKSAAQSYFGKYITYERGEKSFCLSQESLTQFLQRNDVLSEQESVTATPEVLRDRLTEFLSATDEKAAAVGVSHLTISELPLAAIGEQFSKIAPNPNSILRRIATAVKKAFISIALIAISPIWAITFIVSKIYRAIVSDKKMREAASVAKATIEQKWHTEMARPTENTNTKDLHIDEDMLGRDAIGNKVNRYLWRALAIEGFQDTANEEVSEAVSECTKQLMKNKKEEFTHREIKDMLGSLANTLLKTPSTQKVADQLLTQIDEHTKNIHTRLKQELQAAKHPDKAVAAFNKVIDMLHAQLQKTPPGKDFEEANRATLKLLEEALESEGYSLLKEDRSLPAIKFLHDICLTMHTKIFGMEEYQTMGKNLVSRIETSNKEGWQGLAEDVEKSDELTRRHYNRASTILDKIKYAIEHPMHVLSSLKSVGAIPGTFDPYSAHNYPTLLGETRYGRQAKARTVYAPSPTLGTEIRPLYKGLLQAVENNVFLGTEADPDATKFIFEINYQRMQGEEGRRTRNIMTTVMDYPFSLDTMSLPLETDFYRGKVVQWKESETFYDDFRNHIFGEDGQACRRITAKGCGYFFTSRVSDEDIDDALDATKEMFQEIEEEGTEDWKELAGQQKQRLFQDVFHLLIRLQAEKKYARQSQNILNYSHCKQHIDRGGMMTLFYTLALQAATPKEKALDSEQLRSLICGALPARALTIDSRSIIKDYAEETAAFLRHIPQEALGKAIHSLIGKSPPITFETVNAINETAEDG